MRVFKGRSFDKFARKSKIRDEDLCLAIEAVNCGQIDADLGGGVYKQRLARQGQGKSGGYRSIILLRHGTIALFVFGFAKKDIDNISRQDLLEFRNLAKELFQYGDKEIEKLIAAGAIKEICL